MEMNGIVYKLLIHKDSIILLLIGFLSISEIDIKIKLKEFMLNGMDVLKQKRT